MAVVPRVPFVTDGVQSFSCAEEHGVGPVKPAEGTSCGIGGPPRRRRLCLSARRLTASPNACDHRCDSQGFPVMLAWRTHDG